MKKIDILAAILIVIGALNWGLFGLLQFDLVGSLFGGMGAMIARIVYVLVGVAGIYQALQWKAIQRRWHVVSISA